MNNTPHSHGDNSQNRFKSKSKNKGFTLLEIMVAIAILAVAMTAVIKATGQVSSNAFMLRQKTFAHWVAQNKMNELILEKAWPSIGNDKEEAVLADLDWDLVITTTSTGFETVRKVEVDVLSPDTPDEITGSITGYLLDPNL